VQFVLQDYKGDYRQQVHLLITIRFLKPLFGRLVGVDLRSRAVDPITVVQPPPFLLTLLRIPVLMGKREDSAVNTSCHVQILGVGTDTGCTVPSVLLFFDRKRYLFNVGEGFQRFCVEHKIKLTKVTSVLSTRATTHTLGGLPGMLLTMKDATAGGLLAGHISFDVHGPTGLQNAVSAFRTFINLKDMGLQTKQFGSERKGLFEACEPVVSNESVSIKPIIIHPAFQKDFSDEPSLKRQKVDGKEENGTTKGDETTVSYQESPVSAYICQLADIPGKFLPQKAASLGVPRGPLYGKLVKGETVQGANGRLVTPEEVMEPSTPGPTVILVDCPSEEYIPGLADTTDGVGSWAHQSERRGKGAFFLLIIFHPRCKNITLFKSRLADCINS